MDRSRGLSRRLEAKDMVDLAYIGAPITAIEHLY
jgi:hypothetical protein